MRTALGPNRATKKPSPPAPLVSLCVVTHLTNHPFHKGRQEIVKMCLDSLIKGVKKIDHELIIWDNASTPEFRDFLRSYKPFVFIESENVGGYNGRRGALGIARGKYACITDDDVLFSPTWFAQQMEVIRAFPFAIANGIPRDYKAQYGPPLSLFGEYEVYQGKVIPDDWRRELKLSGIHFVDSPRYDEYLVVKDSVRAWINVTDVQLFGETKVLRDIHIAHYSPFLGTSGYLCEKIQSSGHAQLATFQRTVAHIGNVIDESILKTKESMTQPPFNLDLKRMTRVKIL